MYSRCQEMSSSPEQTAVAFLRRKDARAATQQKSLSSLISETKTGSLQHEPARVSIINHFEHNSKLVTFQCLHFHDLGSCEASHCPNVDLDELQYVELCSCFPSRKSYLRRRYTDLGAASAMIL